MHIKKGDKVIVIAGKEKGKTSVIVHVDRENNRVTLEGLNMVKKHTRPTKAGAKGGIIDVAASIHASNVMLADKVSKNVKSTKENKEKKTIVKKKTVKKGE